MVNLKSCPRCNGDMMLEEFLGETELVCLQCGYRTEMAPAKRAPATVRVRLRDAA